MATFQKLTRPNIKALQPGQKIIEHGIVFERRANGDGVYSVGIMVDRQRIHRVVGKESDGTTRTQCEQFIEKARTEAREGRLALPRGRKVALIFRDAADKYIKRLEETDGKGVDRKRRQLNIHLTPFFGSKSLSQVKDFDIARYKKVRTDAGAKPATINRELAVLSHMFSKGVSWGWISHRPAKIERLAEQNGRLVYLTSDQCQRLLEAARNDISPHIFPFCLIALSTSMRMSEILTLKREYVDLERRRLFIPKAKAGAREQPITTELAAFLRDHLDRLPKGTEWLFPSVASKSGRLATIRKAHRRVVKAAGLDPDVVVRHTMRHTAVTHLVQANVDLPTIQKISGHKTLAMVARYAHANGTHIDAAMARLEVKLSEASNVVPIVKAAKG